MWLQVAETWLLLKHCWKMISVINTSASQLFLCLFCSSCCWSHAVGGSLVAATCCGIGCSHTLASWANGGTRWSSCCLLRVAFSCLDHYVLRDTQAALIGVFTAWVSASRREVVWEEMLWIWEIGGHKGCKSNLKCRGACSCRGPQQEPVSWAR